MHMDTIFKFAPCSHKTVFILVFIQLSTQICFFFLLSFCAEVDIYGNAISTNKIRSSMRKGSRMMTTMFLSSYLLGMLFI